MSTLSSFIRFSQSNISTSYVKGSGTAIPSITIGIENLSPDKDIQVNILSDFGVKFTPSLVDIPHNGQATVIVSFDTTILDQNVLGGLNTIRCVINLASTTPPTSLPQTPSPPAAKRWFNVTINQWVDALPPGAVICPPGTSAFYENGDPNGVVCVTKHTPPSTPTKPPLVNSKLNNKLV